LNDSVLDELQTDVRKKGGKIIANKGATFYGVAQMLTHICKAIIENREVTLPLSAPVKGLYGIKHDLFLGTPAVINSNGIADVIETKLSDEELKKMNYSADKMQKVVDGVQL
jgi:L-lactate dehydrogenase